MQTTKPEKYDKRLETLICSGLCPAEDASKHAAELRRIADEVAVVGIADKQSRFFKALADETRLRILKLLGVKEMCVCEIMVALGLTQPSASHHLGILENVGIVKDRKEGKWVFYSLSKPSSIKNVLKSSIP